MHAVVQARYDAYGDWKCPAGDTKTILEQPGKCPACVAKSKQRRKKQEKKEKQKKKREEAELKGEGLLAKLLTNRLK